jgi:hypothetical protein
MKLPAERLMDLSSIYGALKQVASLPTPAQVAGRILATQRALTSQVKESIHVKTYIQETDSESSKVTNYLFDAVLQTTHNTRRQITSHPVQFGAAISEHSYQLPAELTIEIGMSDVMETPLMTVALDHDYGSGDGKSVNAYQKFLELQKKGQPLSVNTRLFNYKNMVIEGISVVDDYTTSHSLRCSISLKEIFIGELGKSSRGLYVDTSQEPTNKIADVNKNLGLLVSNAATAARYGYVYQAMNGGVVSYLLQGTTVLP